MFGEDTIAGKPGIPGTGSLTFSAITPVPSTVDAFTVPSGYRWDPVIRWGARQAWQGGRDRAQPAQPEQERARRGDPADRGKPYAPTFAWNLILICGDAATAGTYFGGWAGEVSPISCPDNVAFDSLGNLWVSTDGQPGTIGLNDGLNDGLFKVPVAGPERGRVQQFLAGPIDAETCGPVIHDKDGSVFVAVQHPGEDGSWVAQRSRFPDYVSSTGTAAPGDFAGPRPTVVQVTQG